MPRHARTLHVCGCAHHTPEAQALQPCFPVQDKQWRLLQVQLRLPRCRSRSAPDVALFDLRALQLSSLATLAAQAQAGLGHRIHDGCYSVS